MLEIAGAVVSLIISYIPFYFLSNRIFDRYKLILSFGLFYMAVVVIGYVLQFFKILFSYPVILGLLYILAIRYGKYEKPDKKIIPIFIMIFVMTSLPLFFVETPPIQGSDISFHAYLTKLIVEKNSVFIDWGLMSDSQVNYPFGFHIFTGMLYFLNLSKIINLLFVVPVFLFAVFAISVYPIAREFGLDRNKSLFSIIMIAYGPLFVLFPNTWGGIAQLSGMMMMNFAFFFMVRYDKQRSRQNLFLYSLSSAVLFISHYWVFFLFGSAVVFFWISKKLNKKYILRSLHGPVLGLLFLSPWIFRVTSNISSRPGIVDSVTGLASRLQYEPVLALKTFLVLGPVLLFLAAYSWDRKYLAWNSKYSAFYIWIGFSIFMVFSQYLDIPNLFNPGRWMYGLGIPLSVLSVIGFYKLYERYLTRINFRTILLLFIIANVVVMESYFLYSSLINHPPVPKNDYDTFLYMRDLPDDTLIHAVGLTGYWIPFVSEKKITTPMLAATEVNLKSFEENMEKFEEMYENMEWDRLEEEGVEHIFISENEDAPGECDVVHKRLFKCG